MRLLERWGEVQQRIEKLQAEDAAGGRGAASGLPTTAPPPLAPSKKELPAPGGTTGSDGVEQLVGAELGKPFDER